MATYGPEYISLLLANSESGKHLYNMEGQFSQMKEELLNKQLQRFRNQYIPNMVKTDNPSSEKAQEVIKALQDIGITQNKIGDKLVESIQAELDKNQSEVVTSGSQIGNLTSGSGKAISYQSIGNLSPGNLNKMTAARDEMIEVLNQLTDNLQTVIDDAKNKVQQMYDAIAASSEVEMSILQKLANIDDGTLPADELLSAALGKNAAKNIQAFVLTQEEQKALKALQTSNPDMLKLVNNYSRIQGDIGSLKYLSNGSISAGAIESAKDASGEKSQVVRQLIGKIGGSFSDASSVFTETVVATAASGALAKDDVVKTLQETIGDHVETMVEKTGGVGDFVRFTAKLKTDPNFAKDIEVLQKWEEKIKNAANNKNDVSVTITADEISLSFGFSVKGSAKSLKKGSQGKVTAIKMEQDTTLLHIFTVLAGYDTGVTLPGIYNLAGGAVGDLKGYGIPPSLQAYMHKQERQDAYSKETAEQVWDELVDYAEVGYFLNALAGNGSLLNNNLFLSYNNKLVPISTILAGAANYLKDGKSIASYRIGKNMKATRSALSFQANQFVKAENGQTSTDKAIERSYQAEENLTKAFQKRQVTTLLNTTFLTTVINSL